MDSDTNPVDYRDASTTVAIEHTRESIANITKMDPNHTLICPIITPRYAPSCSSTLLYALGILARETSLPIQTHISENPSELELVADLFPDYDSYAAVYDGHHLLTPRSVLAHAVHLSPAERALIKKRGSKISHCPVSNSCISSGLCPVRQFLDDGIEVGLGTDVSGGYSPSVLVAAREAAIVSRVLSSVQRDFQPGEPHRCADRHNGKEEQSCTKSHGHKSDPNKKKKEDSHKWDRTRLTVEECLYLATVGGACCLGLEHKVGRFEVGMEWDAQLVRLGPSSPAEASAEAPTEDQTDVLNKQQAAVTSPKTKTSLDDDDDNPVTLWDLQSWSEKLAKWIFNGDDRNTRAVWVRGKLVHQRS